MTLGANVTSDIIGRFYEHKIASIALPTHTSDLLYLLDVSLFSPFKSHANTAIDEAMKKVQQCT